jgi:hypothetical protein
MEDFKLKMINELNEFENSYTRSMNFQGLSKEERKIIHNICDESKKYYHRTDRKKNIVRNQLY